MQMIHIACNIDSNYIRHCSVTLVSLFENNRDEHFCIHILADRLNQKDKETLESITYRYGNEIRFYSPDPKLLEGFTIRKFSKRISMATYYRCILSDIIPASVDKLLYLDCDIVVMGSIREFWNTDLEGIGVAAVEDIGCDEKERYEILKYPAEDSYFNAGVLLINLKYWREHNVGKACIKYYHDYPERILFNDQDLLNSILHDSKIMTDLKWNVQDGFYRTPRNMSEQWKRKYSHVLKNPVILHYTNRKPWDYDSQHPLKDEYRKYLDLTQWKGDYPWLSAANRVKRFFRLLPFYINLRRPKYIDLKNI